MSVIRERLYAHPVYTTWWKEALCVRNFATDGHLTPLLLTWRIWWAS